MRDTAVLGQRERVPADVSDMVLEAAIRVARETPDPHQERVRIAVKHLTDGVLDAEQVAQAVIRSIIADSDR